MRWSLRLPSLVLVCTLAACEAESWGELGGLRAFRQVEAPEARRLLREPGASVLQLRTTPYEPRLPQATVLAVDAPLPDALLGAGRILVVTQDVAAGRRLSARLVRAGARRVALVVEDPVELGAPGRPLLARPMER